MKRFVIAAIFSVDAYNKRDAEALANDVRTFANGCCDRVYLLFDENRCETKEVPLKEELPHAYED